MMKTLERQHANHIVKAPYGLKLLPIAAIFGANASGKSNFIRALKVMRSMVVNNEKSSIPFMLDDDYGNKEINFTIKLLSKGYVYEYSFSILKKNIQEEYLKKNSPTEELLLFHRKNGKIQLDAIQNSDIKNRLNVQYDGTDEKQLFLNNAYFQNKNHNAKELQHFKNIYDWFNKLVIIEAGSQAVTNPFGDILYEKTNALIPLFDLGFEKGEVLRKEITDPDILKQLKDFFETDNINAIQLNDLVNSGHFFEEKDGKFFSSKILLSFRAGEKETKLPWMLASDGSKRIIQLSPILHVLIEHDAVVVIDELDRSLHTLLARRFIEKFLEDCSSDRRSQLIFTTHDVTLMDQDIFRRDELWIVERTNEHVSKMFSLIEYKDIRNDKDIRRSYLNGRFGGIPKILL
ncbi:AAA family ATPase [Commensalibacter communis]